MARNTEYGSIGDPAIRGVLSSFTHAYTITLSLLENR
jgi:hypothetical protein